MATKRLRRPDETWEEMQARIVAETSDWLTHAMQHPELAVRIPTIEAGAGRFPRSLTVAFWDSVLEE